MKNKISTFLAVLVVAGFSAAHAEEVEPSDLSTINGQIVPVGVHNEYKHSYPKLNIATNPISIPFGVYGLAASYAVSPNVAIKVDGAYFDIIDSDNEGFEVDVTVPIYFRKVYTGFFLEPGVMVRRYGSDDSASSDDDDLEVGPQAMAGYHFLADNGLNISVAAGAGRSFTGNKDPFVNGYVRFGYAF